MPGKPTNLRHHPSAPNRAVCSLWPRVSLSAPPSDAHLSSSHEERIVSIDATPSPVRLRAVSGPGQPFRAVQNAVSSGFFDVLGARPMLGRTLSFLITG